MIKDCLNNLNIVSERVLLSPEQLRSEYPMNDSQVEFIRRSRETIGKIVDGSDPRLMVICGPCSIHDTEAAKAYASQLKQLQRQYKDSLCLVMRVYFEKPRTTVGWKGLVNDPDLDDSFRLEKGLRMGRELLLHMAELELPVATEALDPISPQYLSDLFSWAAIGARTTESQTHRELASGLSMPVGFKNGTDGSIEVAVNALEAAGSGHSFMGLSQSGQVTLVTTRGNQHGHVILRGGKEPNFSSAHIRTYSARLREAGLNPRMVVDCSHGNSNKDYTRQPLVARDVASQIAAGERDIIGIMLESHINAGNQKLGPRESLKYGVSVTDACISFETTAQLLAELHQTLQPVIAQR